MNEPTIKLVLPKGRIQEKVMAILGRAGLHFRFHERSYRPVCSDSTIEVKLLKPQNISTLVSLGRHDLGFSGHDWVVEQHANVTEVLDLGYDPVRIVAAIPDQLAAGDWRKQHLIVATEYPAITQRYIDEQKLEATVVKAYGATEALPPEDADMIVDNTSTGTTLRMNQLTIVDTLMQSTTRMIANPEALKNPQKAERIEELAMLMRAALTADERVLLEMNVSTEAFEKVVNGLPAMRSPTIAPLHNQQGYAVKIAVSKKEAPKLIVKLSQLGATDILQYTLDKIVS